MSDIDREALTAAVSALIEDPDADRMFKQMVGVYELAKKGVPVRLTGRPAVLNPLLDLMLDDYPTYESVLALVDRKREAADSEPLNDVGFDRRSYMRELMANKRARQRRLVDLWNQLRPERDRIKGAARMEFERVHADRWLTVRLERESDLRAQLGRRLTNEERTQVIQQLWADVDTELTALSDYVQGELRKPAGARGAEFKWRVVPRKGT